MTSLAICILLLVPQAPKVEPLPATVGHEVRLVAPGPGERTGIPVEVEVPGGERRAVGNLDAAGSMRYVPEHEGHHVFVARIDGVRTLVPFYVGADRPRWLLAFGAVPLGLVLLWANLRRARGRPAP